MARLGFQQEDELRGPAPGCVKPGADDLGPNMNERKPLGQQRTMETAAANRNKKANAKAAKLSRDVQARLGQQLRAMYDDVVNQGVPDRFTDLLNRMNGGNNRDKH
jgi:hypothetical protein